jgi:hypothetical protein
MKEPFPLLSSFLGTTTATTDPTATSDSDPDNEYGLLFGEDEQSSIAAKSTGSSFWDEVAARMDQNFAVTPAKNQRQKTKKKNHQRESFGMQNPSQASSSSWRRRRTVPQEETFDHVSNSNFS